MNEHPSLPHTIGVPRIRFSPDPPVACQVSRITLAPPRTQGLAPSGPSDPPAAEIRLLLRRLRDTNTNTYLFTKALELADSAHPPLSEEETDSVVGLLCADLGQARLLSGDPKGA